MGEEEGSTSKASSLPSSTPTTLASRDSQTKMPPTSPPLRSSSSASSHLLDLPLRPDPLLRDRVHAAESDLVEGREGDAELASEMVNQEKQQKQSQGTPVPPGPSLPLDNSLPSVQQEDQVLHPMSSTTLDAPAAPSPPQDDHGVKSGNETIDVDREGASEQCPDIWVEIEVGSGGGEEEGQVDVDEVGGGNEGEVVDAAVESSLLMDDTEQDLEPTSSPQLRLDHPCSQDPSPLGSPKTAGQSEDRGSGSSNGSASNESQPLTSSFNSNSSNPRASSAPPDLPSKKDLLSVAPNPRSCSLPAVLPPRRAASSIEDQVEASRAGSLVFEEQGSQDAEREQELPSVEEEDAYIDASSSQAVALEVEHDGNSDEDVDERRDGAEEDEDDEEEEEKEEVEEEMEVEEGSQSAGSSLPSSLSTRTILRRPTHNRTSSSDLPSSPGPSSSSSSSKRKDPPSPSPTSSSRQTAPPVAKRPKQPFRSPMILSSPGRPSPSLVPSTSSSNDLRRPSASSPPPSPPRPPPPPPPKPKRPKSTFKALTVSLPPPPPPPSAAASRKSSSSSMNASKSAPPPPTKRKKAPVVPFQSPMGGGSTGSGGGGGGSAGFSQAKEIAETERKVQMLKQALRFVGTAEGRRKEETETELVEKWKVAGREISQLLWDETPSSRDPSQDSSSTNSTDPSSSPFSFADDQPFGFSSSSSSNNTQQPSPFLSSFEPQSFETSFGFSSTTTASSSHAYSNEDSTMDDLLEPDSDSSLPSPKTVSRQIDQTLAKRANGGRVGLGVRAYLEDRRERMGSGSRSIVEGEEEDVEGDDDEHDEEEEENTERERKRKRQQAQSWNVGEMLRRRFGVDPVLFGWDDECEDWL